MYKGVGGWAGGGDRGEWASRRWVLSAIRVQIVVSIYKDAHNSQDRSRQPLEAVWNPTNSD